MTTRDRRDHGDSFQNMPTQNCIRFGRSKKAARYGNGFEKLGKPIQSTRSMGMGDLSDAQLF
jgi:hypothetical protein